MFSNEVLTKYGWMDGSTDRWIDGSMDRWIDGCKRSSGSYKIYMTVWTRNNTIKTNVFQHKIMLDFVFWFEQCL